MRRVFESVLILICAFALLGSRNGCCAVFIDQAKITEVLQASYDCHKTNPAVAVALVKDGQTIYSRGFGHTTLEKTTPVTDETLFGIASITKSFAAALLVKLLHEKTNLTINSKVRELLRDEFVLNDEFRTKEMTFLDMMSHKTAILANNRIRLDSNLTRDNVLSRLRLLPSNKQFRVDYVYNNLVYGLISRISEIIAGHGVDNNKRWEDLIEEHLFKPLGMDKSTFATRVDFDRMDLAAGYSELDGPEIMTKVSPQLSRRWAEMCGSGAIISSVKEMANWLKFHLSLGKNSAGDTVMEEDLVKELHKPRLALRSLKYLGIERPDFPITVMETAYAMGLRVGHYRGYPHIAHTGGTYGYGTYMIMLPSQNIGAIILTTGRDVSFRQRAAVAHYLIDSALDNIDPYITKDTICTFPKPWMTKDITSSYRPQPSNETLSFKVEEYKGLYTEVAFGNLEIDYNSTSQSLVMRYGWGVWEMIVWPDTSNTDNNEQRFYGKGIGPDFAPDMKPLYFIEHPDVPGTVIGFRGNAFESKLPPIFCKERDIKVCSAIRRKLYPKPEPVTVCPSSATSPACGKGIIVFVFFTLLAFTKSISI